MELKTADSIGKLPRKLRIMGNMLINGVKCSQLKKHYVSRAHTDFQITVRWTERTNKMYDLYVCMYDFYVCMTFVTIPIAVT